MNPLWLLFFFPIIFSFGFLAHALLSMNKWDEGVETLNKWKCRALNAEEELRGYYREAIGVNETEFRFFHSGSNLAAANEPEHSVKRPPETEYFNGVRVKTEEDIDEAIREFKW